MPVLVMPRERRTVPAREVLVDEPGALDGVDPAVAEGFASLAVVRTRAALNRFAAEMQPGLEAADRAALERIEQRWTPTDDPDAPGLPPLEAPGLVLLGRQDIAAGYVDQLAMLPRQPHSTVAVLDAAGNELHIERPAIFDALTHDWLDRVEARR